MQKLNHIFKTILFEANSIKYYPAFMERESWMKENHIPHTQAEIPIGHSRFGGPIIDLPPGIKQPEGLYFAAQIDLGVFAPFDTQNLLPKTGQLLFFADILNDDVQVIYADVSNDQLQRKIDEHEEEFFLGTLIQNPRASTEMLSERIRKAKDRYEAKEADENGYIWDYFAGCEKSKIFGTFTHCQMVQEEIEEVCFSDKVVLLQIGENGFNDEGVLSVLIDKNDLEKRNFADCEFYWAQS